ncbi:hypothetical protein ACPVPU_12105 [Sphingomonas sp. CJ99]
MTDRSPLRWWQTRWFAVVAVLAAAIPLLWPALPPFTDLPGHVGRYRVMLDGGEGPLARFFLFEWRWTGNLGVDLIVAALGPVIGLEPAVKLAVLSIPMLTVAAILALSRELHGRVTPFALFALPLVYSFALHFGFINYTLSMALALSGVVVWLRLGRLGRIRQRALLAIPFSFLLWTTHIVGWGMMSTLILATALADRLSQGRGWSRAVPLAAMDCLPMAGPLLLVAAPLWSAAAGGGAPMGPFLDWRAKLVGLGMIARDRWLAVDLATILLPAGLIVAAGIGVGGRFERRGRWMTGAVLAVYIAMPFTLMGSAYADIRLAPYLMMVALLAIGPVPIGRPGIGALAAAAVAFAGLRLAATTTSLALIDRDWQRELAALDHVPDGARVMAMIGQHCADPWARTRLDHLPGMAMARRRAVTNNQWGMSGGALMAVRRSPSDYFDHDPSQFVLDTPCPGAGPLLTQAQSLARFPRERFTHLWMIRPHPLAPGATHRMRRIWTNGDSALFEIMR